MQLLALTLGSRPPECYDVDVKCDVEDTGGTPDAAAGGAAARASAAGADAADAGAGSW